MATAHQSEANGRPQASGLIPGPVGRVCRLRRQVALASAASVGIFNSALHGGRFPLFFFHSPALERTRGSHTKPFAQRPTENRSRLTFTEFVVPGFSEALACQPITAAPFVSSHGDRCCAGRHQLVGRQQQVVLNNRSKRPNRSIPWRPRCDSRRLDAGPGRRRPRRAPIGRR